MTNQTSHIIGMDMPEPEKTGIYFIFDNEDGPGTQAFMAHSIWNIGDGMFNWMEILTRYDGHRIQSLAQHDEEIRRSTIANAPESTSDGYHTFKELYKYRMLYHAWAVRAWIAAGYTVVKSYRHSNNELCFGGGWFIVSAQLPTGQVSNHYENQYWDLFDVPEQRLAPGWDGHTPDTAAKRIELALFTEDKQKRRIMTHDSARCESLPGIPMVRAVDPDGRVLEEGWYFRHVNRQPCPGDDRLRPEDVDECIVTDGSADWNLEPPVRLLKITPPTRIEIIKEERA